MIDGELFDSFSINGPNPVDVRPLSSPTFWGLSPHNISKVRICFKLLCCLAYVGSWVADNFIGRYQ